MAFKIASASLREGHRVMPVHDDAICFGQELVELAAGSRQFHIGPKVKVWKVLASAVVV